MSEKCMHCYVDLSLHPPRVGERGFTHPLECVIALRARIEELDAEKRQKDMCIDNLRKQLDELSEEARHYREYWEAIETMHEAMYPHDEKKFISAATKRLAAITAIEKYRRGRG